MSGLINGTSAAKLFGVNPSTVSRWRDSGLLPSIPIENPDGVTHYYPECAVKALKPVMSEVTELFRVCRSASQKRKSLSK